MVILLSLPLKNWDYGHVLLHQVQNSIFPEDFVPSLVLRVFLLTTEAVAVRQPSVTFHVSPTTSSAPPNPHPTPTLFSSLEALGRDSRERKRKFCRESRAPSRPDLRQVSSPRAIGGGGHSPGHSHPPLRLEAQRPGKQGFPKDHCKSRPWAHGDAGL